ncbi:hypothetical protein GCM10023149_06380 [Mucilaginibacter gynuensis]|uniref:Uncharacterized protein n=1 Tax=Mucilaginibacter gynuensis TaxID=1302236 RepID=A0ABP8FV04_9SPHI
MRKNLILILLLAPFIIKAQSVVDLSNFTRNGEVKAIAKGSQLSISWPSGNNEQGSVTFNLKNKQPLFKSIGIQKDNAYKEIATELDPGFILTVGKRDLISQNGWNIFFDKVPKKPHQSYTIDLKKQNASVATVGSRTVVKVPGLSAPGFSGYLEVTFYNGSPLFNVAAVMTTQKDSTAILYDAALISKKPVWNSISWADTQSKLQSHSVQAADSSRNLAVKYRTIIGEGEHGSLAVFPAPHQYFYPLDEAFNLKFTWFGNNYRDLLKGYGIGIRQDLEGDRRFVPWFNSPPNTHQRLNFYCLLDDGAAGPLLTEVKRFTHNDVYKPVSGYKTMASHFHNEFIMQVVMAHKPVPDSPNFVKVFKNMGVNIVHLAEFHYTAHPKGPDEKRLAELSALFKQCKRLSDKTFLLLPGEEPNEFFGGHWLDFFPKPVYWIMSRKADQPFVTEDPQHGKVYHIGDKQDMLKLLEAEKGLAWTAHARTKGSTGFPDAYKNEPFYLSDRFMGAAWKHIPADLSLPRMGKRALDLLDDMNNWGLKKHMIGEADLFTIEPENEMYAHMNVNYLQLADLPDYDDGWQPVLNAMQQGKFFTTTGEVLFPSFTINDKGAGETAQLDKRGNAIISLSVNWTFPLNFIEIISGDGKETYRQKIDMNNTKAFGTRDFTFTTNLKGRKWARIEAWDVAANGAYTQTVYLK